MKVFGLNRNALPTLELLLGIAYGVLTVLLAGEPDYQASFNSNYYFVPGLLFGCCMLLWEKIYLKSFRLLLLVPLAVLLYFISSLLALHFTFDSLVLRVMVSLGVGALNAAIYSYFAVERFQWALSPLIWYAILAGLVSVIPYILAIQNLDFWVYTLYGTGMLLAFRYAVIRSRLD